MSHLFCFIAQKTETPGSDEWLLEPFELEHARKVLKLKVGDTVQVIDGKGGVAVGVIAASGAQRISVKSISVEYFAKPELKTALALGALKPGDFDDILPGIVEWGVDQIHIFLQQDTAKFRTADKARERWERILVSAVKQCKRPWLPTIFVHDSLANALEALKGFDQKIVLDAAGSASMRQVLNSLPPTRPLSIACVVGGERGINAQELETLGSQGFLTVSMGSHVLRATTAALGAAALLGSLLAG